MEFFARRVQDLRASMPEKKLSAEVDNLEDALLAAAAGIDIVQCEKFSCEALAATVGALRGTRPDILILAAGGVTGETAAEYAATGVDVLVTSTQKALALPPGMAVCTLSQKAYERTASVPNRGCYFDLRSIYDTIQKKDYQYTNTPCISIMYAMDLQLQRIMQEGVENRFARHEAMAEFVRSWADEYFSVFANRDHLSRTLTVISNTRDIDIAALNNSLIERGMQLGNGYGDLKNKTFRIAHMGELTMDDMRSITSSIVDILKLK